MLFRNVFISFALKFRSSPPTPVDKERALVARSGDDCQNERPLAPVSTPCFTRNGTVRDSPLGPPLRRKKNTAGTSTFEPPPTRMCSHCAPRGAPPIRRSSIHHRGRLTSLCSQHFHSKYAMVSLTRRGSLLLALVSAASVSRGSGESTNGEEFPHIPCVIQRTADGCRDAKASLLSHCVWCKSKTLPAQCVTPDLADVRVPGMRLPNTRMGVLLDVRVHKYSS